MAGLAHFAANPDFNFHAPHHAANWRQYGGATDADKRNFAGRPFRMLLCAGTTLFKPISVYDPLRADNEPIWHPFYFVSENWNKLLYCEAQIQYFVSINVISPVYAWQGKVHWQGAETEQVYVPNMDLNFRSHGKGLGFPFRRFAGGYVVNQVTMNKN